jgi:hypothetical protein
MISLEGRHPHTSRSHSLISPRSTAPNSLSIWTHHFRGLDYQPTFIPKGCKKQYQDTLTIAAGNRMKDVYAFAAKHNRAVVGGMDPNVGIGGFITAGGHSPISTAYGLGSDHVLDFEVVTPDGAIRTANECQNTDLFWAMKGVSISQSNNPQY